MYLNFWINMKYFASLPIADNGKSQNILVTFFAHCPVEYFSGKSGISSISDKFILVKYFLAMVVSYGVDVDNIRLIAGRNTLPGDGITHIHDNGVVLI